MPVQNVKQLCETTKKMLKEANEKLETFLNYHSMDHFVDEEMKEFYRGFLSDMRTLLVFSEVEYEKLGIALRRPTFHEAAAEKTLYEVYHNVVNNFFYPKHESYSEDGRYAYTGQDAIRFRLEPEKTVRDITLDLAKIFEELREMLAYYETDYANHLRMKGEKV